MADRSTTEQRGRWRLPRPRGSVERGRVAMLVGAILLLLIVLLVMYLLG